MSLYCARSALIGMPAARSGDVVIVGRAAGEAYEEPQTVVVDRVHGQAGGRWLVSAFDPAEPRVRLSIWLDDLSALVPTQPIRIAG